MDVEETFLPGFGMRYEFTTEHGERMAIIAARSGSVDLVAYDDEDPDESIGMVRLSRSEVETVAELLGAPRITARVADLTKEVPGLVSRHITIPSGSKCAGHPLGDAAIRTRTGTSVVAIVRGDDVISSPAPDHRLEVGDTVVVIGTEGGVESAAEIIAGTS